MQKIPNTEALLGRIDQNGITTGPKKLEIFRKACELRGVPTIQDGMALVKIFDPCGSGTWYVSEWDQDSDICYGLVDWFELEYGTFDLREMSEIAGPLRIGLEVDVHWLPTPMNELYAKLEGKRVRA